MATLDKSEEEIGKVLNRRRFVVARGRWLNCVRSTEKKVLLELGHEVSP